MEGGSISCPRAHCWVVVRPRFEPESVQLPTCPLYSLHLLAGEGGGQQTNRKSGREVHAHRGSQSPWQQPEDYTESRKIIVSTDKVVGNCIRFFFFFAFCLGNQLTLPSQNTLELADRAGKSLFDTCAEIRSSTGHPQKRTRYQRE